MDVKKSEKKCPRDMIHIAIKGWQVFYIKLRSISPFVKKREKGERGREEKKEERKKDKRVIPILDLFYY